MHDELREGSDFQLAEYRESANAYFKGVDIGYTTVRSYITINGLFAALIGALAEPKGQLLALSEITKIIPFFALVASLALIAALPHYYKHLENCRLRCEQIERLRGGKLFTELGVVEKGSWFTSNAGLKTVIYSIVVFWVYFAIRGLYPEFDLAKAVDYLFSALRRLIQ